MQPVIKTDISFDYRQLLIDYNQVEIPEDNSYDQNQVAITSSDGNNILVDNKFNEDYIRILEADLNLMNEWFKNTYVAEVIDRVNQKYNTTKWRFMKLTSERRAYSYHKDETKRLHIPLLTNDECFFIIEKKLYTMQQLGWLYEMDTTKHHTALNLGWSDRVHIVGAYS
tara:strand:+ start:297 stop:803 length:507 start_codon:yes stop_codon:yes gene_type:complete